MKNLVTCMRNDLIGRLQMEYVPRTDEIELQLWRDDHTRQVRAIPINDMGADRISLNEVDTYNILMTGIRLEVMDRFELVARSLIDKDKVEFLLIDREKHRWHPVEFDLTGKEHTPRVEWKEETF